MKHEKFLGKVVVLLLNYKNRIGQLKNNETVSHKRTVEQIKTFYTGEMVPLWKKSSLATYTKIEMLSPFE